MKRERVRIDALYLGLYDGPHATPKPSDSGPIFLGIGNITPEGQLDLSDVRHIAEEDYSAWTKRVVPQSGDIVFTYEATLNLYASVLRELAHRCNAPSKDVAHSMAQSHQGRRAERTAVSRSSASVHYGIT